jgi:hypothetical protein
MINPDRIYNTREAQAEINKARAKRFMEAIARDEVTCLCRYGNIFASKVGGRYLIRGDRLRDYMVRMGLEVDHA